MPTSRDGAKALPTTKLRYEPSFDGLRAIAILAVVLFHTFQKYLPGGMIGVDLFFVLSGYLITRLLSEEIKIRGRIHFGQFYSRRALRLVPAFAVLLGIYLALLAALPQFFVNGWREVAFSAAYLMNWNRAFHWMPDGFLTHTWSLAAEEQFYLLWPPILASVNRRRPIAWAAALLIAVIAWRLWLLAHGASTERVYNGFDTHSDSLLLGCLLALSPVSATVRSFAIRFVAIPIAALIACLFILHFDGSFTLAVGLTFCAFMSTWLVVAAMEDGRLRQFLSVRPLVYTGRISYGWYLWHYPILLFGMQFFVHKVRAGALLIPVSYIAAASYKWIERPFPKLKNRFEPKYRKVVQREVIF